MRHRKLRHPRDTLQDTRTRTHTHTASITCCRACPWAKDQPSALCPAWGVARSHVRRASGNTRCILSSENTSPDSVINYVTDYVMPFSFPVHSGRAPCWPMPFTPIFTVFPPVAVDPARRSPWSTESDGWLSGPPELLVPSASRPYGRGCRLRRPRGLQSPPTGRESWVRTEANGGPCTLKGQLPGPKGQTPGF